MRFLMPHHPCEFEIPDDWLAEAGALSFTPTEAAFRAKGQASLVPLTEVEPVPRFIGYPKDWRGFDRTRLISVLSAIVNDHKIEPVPVVQLAALEFGSSPYRYRILDGFHRFYGSISMGCTHLPVR